MHDQDKKDDERPRRIAAAAQDLAELCEDRQKYHASKAQQFGYSKDIFSGIASATAQVPDDPIFALAENSLNTFAEFIKCQEAQLASPDVDVSSMAYALGTAVTVSTTAVSVSTALITPQHLGSRFDYLGYPKPPPSWGPEREEVYAQKLADLHPELGKLYRSVWQSFYGGTDNAERAAMLSMRQLYDHLFEILTPDDQVRGSRWFTPKKGEQPNKIHRGERINFAANERVKDKALGSVLAAQANHILQVYDDLNKLHKRGELKRPEVHGTLAAMKTIIEQWADAIG